MWMPADISGVLHDRAIVSLRSHLRGQRHHATRGHVMPEDPVTVAGHEGRLLALEHVGAITAEEVESWRRRLQDAGSWREPACEPPSERVRALAVNHLDGLLAPLAASAREGATACFSAIAAFEKAGILTADDALARREQLRARLGLEPERSPRCSRKNLLRVIAGPRERMHGLRITTLELYDDGVVLQWHHAREWADGPGTPRVWNDIDVETADADDLDPHALTDDLGTRYIGGDGPDFGINGGGWVVRFGASVFTPAVPARATRLHVPLCDGDIEVDLRHD